MFNPIRSLAAAAVVLAVLDASCTTASAGDLSAPGPFAAGTRSVTVTRPGGTTFTATLHYPATSAGSGTPFAAAAAPCPAITFGHGFLQPVSQYASTLAHLATHGFIVIASQSEGGLFPSHANFASDLRSCLDWLEQQDASAGSELFAAIDTNAFGAGGHSMGGGASILAAKDDARIKALAPTAPADTSPSSIAAMSAVTAAIRLIVGSQDSIVPRAGSAQPMYANAAGPRQLLSIQGGFHCGFTDASFFGCDSGSITRAQQLAITRRLLTEFFLLHLRGEQNEWRSVWGPALPPASETSVTRDPRIALALDASTAAVPVGSSVVIGGSCANTGASSVATLQLAEAPAGWSVVGSPAATGPIAPGASTPVSVEIEALTGASDGTALVSARRVDDGATRTFAVLALQALPPSSPADLNGDGVVDGNDLGALLGAWGSCPAPCPADLDGNGVVNGADLGTLLGAWS